MPRKHDPEPVGFWDWAKLQFGRGCYAAETSIVHSLHYCCRGASIRPRLLCRGNLAREGVSEDIGTASIRPRLLCRGNYLLAAPRAVPTDASIRPRLLCRGNRKRSIWREQIMRLQFGRGCYAAETIGTQQIRVHGAPLQFGRGCYAAETMLAQPKSGT